MPLDPDLPQTRVPLSPGRPTFGSPSPSSASSVRIWVAFFLTTLVTPTIYIGWAHAGGSDPFSGYTGGFFLSMLILHFPSFVVFGFPAFVILQRNAFHSFAAYAVAGGAIGLLNGVVWLIVWHTIKLIEFVAFLSIAGAASGLFFRAIAFPTKAHS